MKPFSKLLSMADKFYSLAISSNEKNQIFAERAIEYFIKNTGAKPKSSRYGQLTTEDIAN